MSRDEVLARVRALIEDVFGVDEAEVEPDSTPGDLGLDSLDVEALWLEIEDRFGITVDDEATPGLRTVQDVANYVYERLGKERASA